MSMNLVPGTQLITEDGVLGTSGKPIRVFSVHLISGATASELTLRNGTLVSSTIYAQETGTADTGATFNYNGGVRFPAGCFVDVDANATSALFVYTEEF